MRRVDEDAKVEMWVSDFKSHDGGGGYHWEWAVRVRKGPWNDYEEVACGFEKTRDIALGYAEDSFEFWGGQL